MSTEKVSCRAGLSACLHTPICENSREMPGRRVELVTAELFDPVDVAVAGSCL
jgi:hypothetical protein